jgi:hypothetical protein
MVHTESAKKGTGFKRWLSFQIYLQINIQIRVVLVVESNESLSSPAERNLLIQIVPPVVHTSSLVIKT